MNYLKPLAIAALAVAVNAVPAARAATHNALRVCADPAYMPYSNRAGQGFENKIARLVAHALHEKLEYTWASERMHGGFDQFLATTLDAHKCDVVMSMPYGNIEELTTQPYYESAYVFIYRKHGPYTPKTMNSSALRQAKVGYVDGTPPETGLKLRDLVRKAVSFHILDHKGQSPKSLLQAVKDKKVDILMAWEPAIGYFLKQYPGLAIARIPNSRSTGSPEMYAFSIAMAVRQHDTSLEKTLNRVIKNKKAQIDHILKQYDVNMPKANVSNTQY